MVLLRGLLEPTSRVADAKNLEHNVGILEHSPYRTRSLLRGDPPALAGKLPLGLLSTKLSQFEKPIFYSRERHNPTRQRSHSRELADLAGQDIGWSTFLVRPL